MARGGKREGAGRKLGARNKADKEARSKASAEGVTPLDYMLKVMRDESQPADRRDRMAMGAAPYMHAKSVEHSGPKGGAIELAWQTAPSAR